MCHCAPVLRIHRTASSTQRVAGVLAYSCQAEVRMSAEEQKVDTVGADRFERDAPVMIYFKTNPPRSPEGCATFCHLSRASNRQTMRSRSCAIPSIVSLAWRSGV